MKVKIDENKGIMIVEIPLQTPKDSKSKKTKVIASGTGDTGTTFKNKPVFISLNAYFKK